MIRLQERDREILKICYEQQFILTEHIRDHFFGGNHAEALRRIIELRNADFLKHSGLKVGKQFAHILGYQGMPVAEARSKVRLNVYPSLDSFTLEHDAIVTEVRLLLQKYWAGNWIPEAAIQKKNKAHIPDGMFAFEDGARAAIEVENSLKGRSRFESRLKFWHKDEAQMVLYIATSKEIYSYLKDYLALAPKQPAFYLITLDDLRAASKYAWNNHFGETDLFSSGDLE